MYVYFKENMEVELSWKIILLQGCITDLDFKSVCCGCVWRALSSSQAGSGDGSEMFPSAWLREQPQLWCFWQKWAQSCLTLKTPKKAQMAPKKADFPSHPLSFCQIHEIRRKRGTKIRDPQWEKLSQHLCRIFYMVSLWITHHHCRNSLYSSGLRSQCSGFHMDLSCMQLKGIFSVLYAFCIFICYLWKY